MCANLLPYGFEQQLGFFSDQLDLTRTCIGTIA